MRSVGTLRRWMGQLLPEQRAEAREGAWQLVRALMVNFTVRLAGLARQLDRGVSAASGRQFLSRWLSRSCWEPRELYQRLLPFWPAELRRARRLALLIDITALGKGWSVLQVSLPWRGRALPVYRLVVRYQEPEEGQTEQVLLALEWLKEQLPGEISRYVLVMDRGFPSHELIREIQARGWRYVLRIGSHWRLTHADYQGSAGQAGGEPCPQRPQGQWLGQALLGFRKKGAKRWCQTNVVIYAHPAHQEVWVLATNLDTWEAAVTIYRQRMQIEAEFRDLKGPWGLDHLEKWEDRERVARMLAWIAVYEWRLALLCLRHAIEEWGRKWLQVGGKLSWITSTRAWVKQHWRAALGAQTLVRESP